MSHQKGIKKGETVGQPMAYVTIRHNGQQNDLSIPRGTTIAGLLAMLEVDVSSEKYAITLSSGKPAPLAAAIGKDLPSGSVVSISGTEASRQAEREALRRTESPWFTQVLIRASVAFFLVPLHTLSIILPLFGFLPPLSLTYRILVATLTSLALGAMIAFSAHRKSAVDHFFITVMVGTTVLALLPGTPQAYSLAPMFFSTGAFLTSLALWTRSRTHTAATFALLWTAALGVTVVALYAAIPNTAMATLALAGSIWGITSTSSFSVRVPDSQLIDLPLVRTIAPSVRAPQTPSPAKITEPRIRRTIREGQEISAALVTAWTTLAFISIPLVGVQASNDDLQGWAASSLLLAATLSLALLPRNTNGRIGHLLPRIPALLGFITLVVALSVRWSFHPTTTVLVLVITAFIIVAATLSALNRPHSAFIGRTADILQALSLLAILPSSVLTSGLFDFVRQVAS